MFNLTQYELLVLIPLQSDSTLIQKTGVKCVGKCYCAKSSPVIHQTWSTKYCLCSF